MSDVSRRSLLVAGAGGAGALALAGCSSSGSSGPTTTASAPSPTSDDASSTSAPSAGSSTGSGSGSGGTPLASVSDLSVGKPKSVTLANGKNGIVTLTSQTTAVAFSAICTHQGCTVKPDGTDLKCPCHQSMFNGTTGAVLQGPAPSPLAKVTVTVTGGEVLES